MSGIRQQQILVIAVIVLLLGFLLSRDVKGLVKPKETEEKGMAATPMPETKELSLTDVSRTAKNLVGTQFTKEIVALENDYQRASGQKKIELAAQLSKKWQDVEQPVPSSLYLEVIAKEQNTLNAWVNAGDQFLRAYENVDSLMQPSLLVKANAAFSQALKIDSTNLAAKAGAGITIVNGMGAPMDGIRMLLDVVKKDPTNLHAQMQLGLFSVKSGQFDKAIERFKKVIEIKKTSDVYFFLGTAYENLGRKEEAIESYLTSKKIAANPNLSTWVDKKVAELKN